MPEYLVFVLHAPIAAFGGLAVGERRGSETRPARSALLGLLAAALGIERTEEARHAALESGYGVAVRVDAPGTPFTDYHTAQMPPVRRGQHHTTRRQELDAKPLETTLSRRDYRTDALFTIAVWATHTGAPLALDDLAAALCQPRFCLSLGRKSCPLGLPPAPVIIQAKDALAAMEAREEPAPEQRLRHMLQARPSLLASDLGGMPDHVPARWTEARRDRIASRDRWQFVLRSERVFKLPLESPP
jgi:CRISPR system Cascade subunit CasD